MSKKIYIIILALLIITALVFLTLFIKPFFDKNPSDKNIFEIIEGNKESENNDEGMSTLVEIPIDFEELWATNTDVYAWITVPGTNIDYPILQCDEDNTYYLNHTWDKQEYKAGSIFTETYNSKDFEDNNTVIYGHNMYARTMFAQLDKFTKADFFDANRLVYIYTPRKILTYEIVAAVPFSDEHLLYKYDFFDEDSYNRFCSDIFSVVDFRASFAENTELEFEKDKLITLSTCMGINDNRRYLVVAKLIEVEE